MSEGLYRLAALEVPGQVSEVLIGDCAGNVRAAITHPNAVCIVEQFTSLNSIEARNAAGDMFITIATLMLDGGKIGLAPIGGFLRGQS